MPFVPSFTEFFFSYFGDHQAIMFYAPYAIWKASEGNKLRSIIQGLNLFCIKYRAFSLVAAGVLRAVAGFYRVSSGCSRFGLRFLVCKNGFCTRHLGRTTRTVAVKSTSWPNFCTTAGTSTTRTPSSSSPANCSTPWVKMPIPALSIYRLFTGFT